MCPTAGTSTGTDCADADTDAFYTELSHSCTDARAEATTYCDAHAQRRARTSTAPARRCTFEAGPQCRRG